MLKERIKAIEFIDLKTQYQVIKDQVQEGINRVLNNACYILGPEVKELEAELAQYTQAKHVISCANGTDALQLMLMAHDVKPNDAVIVPTFTFASTAEVVAQCNAQPIFVDVCPKTFNMSKESLSETLEKHQHLNIKGIIAVDLYGLPADYDSIQQIASAHHLWTIGDAAQSFGGQYQGKQVGNLAHSTTTSFFPSKPLSCYGDGGAIFTNDDHIAQKCISLRNHGCSADRYDHIHIGLNSRLDSIQAAVLLQKLKIFKSELARRHEIAAIYNSMLSEVVQTPITPQNRYHAWGLYTIVCPNDSRAALMQHLASMQIPCNIYYKKPLHLQPAYAHYPKAASLATAEMLAGSVLSLPMNPYLTDEQVIFVAEQVREFYLGSE